MSTSETGTAIKGKREHGDVLPIWIVCIQMITQLRAGILGGEDSGQAFHVVRVRSALAG